MQIYIQLIFFFLNLYNIPIYNGIKQFANPGGKDYDTEVFFFFF